MVDLLRFLRYNGLRVSLGGFMNKPFMKLVVALVGIQAIVMFNSKYAVSEETSKETYVNCYVSNKAKGLSSAKAISMCSEVKK